MESAPTKRLRSFKSRPNERTNDTLSRLEVHGAPLHALLTTNPNWTFSRPLVVEIGCGVGLHPIQYAAEFPTKRIVAIERTSDKFAKFAGRLATHPALHENLCAVHADAIHFLDRYFQNNSIDEVWILYPNPEMKKHSRRWFQSPFMSRLTTLMKPSSTLYFATNIQSYAEDTKALAPTLGLELVRSDVITATSHPTFKPRTHFEKKYYLRGESLFDFEFRVQPTGVHP